MYIMIGEGLFFWLLVLLSNLIVSIVVAIVARAKGRSGIGYFFLSFLLSPIIGFLVLLIMGPGTAKTKGGIVRPPAFNPQKKCPYCAELVKREATTCKHCGKDIDAEAGPMRWNRKTAVKARLSSMRIRR